MTEEKISIVIADDHPIFRRGLREILNGHDRYHVVAEAEDGEQALSLIQIHKPGIAILDISMPFMDGLDVIARIGHRRDQPKFIVLTMFDDEAYLRKALEFGVLGYLLKDNAELELMHCLESVRQKKHYISPVFSSSLVAVQKSGDNALNRLTRSERRIVMLVADSKSSTEIAEILAVSVRTVHNHRHNICKKLNLKGPNALLRFTMKYAKKVDENFAE